MVMHSKGKNGKKDMMKKEDTEKAKTYFNMEMKFK